MPITEDELVEKLNGLGFNVTKRRLTDWRANGLLPDLDSKGHGQGKGRSYYWSEPDIVAHAATVCRLLKWRSRVDKICFPLWLLGYSVPLQIARGKLLDWYDEHFDRFTNLAANQLEDVVNEAVLCDLGWSDNRDWNENDHRVYEASRSPIEAILRAATDPGYKLTNDDVSRFTRQLQGVTADQISNRSPIQAFFRNHGGSLPECVVFVQRNWNLTNVRKLIEDCADEDLRQCHQDLRILVNFLRGANRVLGYMDSWENYLLAFCELAPFAVITELCSRSNGNAYLIDHMIREVIDMTQRIINGKTYELI